ncbi:MAG: 3'(2'),5'-bisphosphate nucleotidase CysQ [Pseudomonadota bacterium]
MSELLKLVEPVLALCASAAERIVYHYQAPGADQYQSKDDNSPLTQADVDSHQILAEGLPSLEGAWPVLSEESGEDERARRRQWRRFWLIDPLDGTREFLERTDEFTINVALIDKHEPAFGVLYEPLKDSACVGIPGAGAWRYTRCAMGQWQREPLSCRALPNSDELVLLASRRHKNACLDACMEWLQAGGRRIIRRNSGSALKFSELAAGLGDFYPRFSPCCEWDVAAGQAIVDAAGGGVFGLDGQPLRYNLSDSLLSPHFYALAEPDHALWTELWRPG